MLSLHLATLPAEYRYAQALVAAHHYLHTPVDSRTSPLAYLVRWQADDGSPPIAAGCLILGYYTRPAGVQAALSHITDPLPTQSTQPRHCLVQPGPTPLVDDCGFRMIQPHEIKAAMAFPEGYIVKGTNRERVRLYGNAVTPPVMQMIMERVVATF